MKPVIIVFLGFFVLSCSSHSESTEKAEPNLDWLLGNWKRTNEEAGKETYESWGKPNDSSYSGIGLTIQKGDTIFQEKMNIFLSGGKGALFVKMPDEEKATEFRLTELTPNAFVFINEANEFPKKIKYWLEGGRIKAVISNDSLEIPFEFEKIKE